MIGSIASRTDGSIAELDAERRTELARLTEGAPAGLTGFTLRQINFSELAPGTIKAFHLHVHQTDVWYVPPGDRMLIVLIDARQGSATEGARMRLVLGDGGSRLLRIPPGVAHGVRNLGTPVFAKSYFARLKNSFGPDCDIVVIRQDGAPVSAVLNFYHKDTVLPYYGGGTAAARRSGANDFLYWEVMRRAALRGYRRFDFGRSKAGTGAFAFKKNWGFEPQWLEYEYHFAPGETMPDKNPLNPKYRLFIETWKKLPLPLANFIGPFLIRGLG